jgi:hypothetical protein
LQPNQYRREDSYYAFLNRQSKTPAPTVVAVAPGFSSFQNGPPFVTFALAVDQALKLVSADGFLADLADTGKIVVLQASIGFVTAVAGVGRAYQGRYAGTVIGSLGYNIHASDQEWFFWNDYSESGGSVGDDGFAVQFDVQNTDVIAHNVTVGFSTIVELYEKQKLTGLSGQQSIVRDAQGNFVR